MTTLTKQQKNKAFTSWFSEVERVAKNAYQCDKDSAAVVCMEMHESDPQHIEAVCADYMDCMHYRLFRMRTNSLGVGVEDSLAAALSILACDRPAKVVMYAYILRGIEQRLHKQVNIADILSWFPNGLPGDAALRVLWDGQKGLSFGYRQVDNVLDVLTSADETILLS
jgi:poly-gamma-glutamate capsule biosynthesis protein CapA/YwtB (metallophosphatase superfamily)